MNVTDDMDRPLRQVFSAEKRAISTIALSIFGTRLAVARKLSITYARSLEPSHDAII